MFLKDSLELGTCMSSLLQPALDCFSNAQCDVLKLMLTPKSLDLAAGVPAERSTVCKLSTSDKTFKQLLNLVLTSFKPCTSLYCSANIRDCFGYTSVQLILGLPRGVIMQSLQKRCGVPGFPGEAECRLCIYSKTAVELRRSASLGVSWLNSATSRFGIHPSWECGGS